MSEIYQLPDNNGSNGMNIPFSIPLGGFGGGGLFGNGNYGMNGLSDMMGLTLISFMLGGGFGFPSSSNLPSVENLNKILEKENKSE